MNRTPDTAPSSDEERQGLLDRCAAADGTALRQLYERVSPLLFAVLTRILHRRALAEEALQDVFVSIWQRAGQFRATRGRPMAWMMSIARYRAIDLLRHERRAPILSPDPAEHEAAAEEGLPGELEWLSGTALLERCMGLLSSEQQQCLRLAYVGGHSHDHIAALTGAPLGSVKSWIRRGLMSLRRCLEAA